jgi:iron complex transport system substrate-binding protein
MRRIVLSVLASGLIAALAAQGSAPSPVVSGAGFSIEYRRGYRILSVKSPWPGATAGFVYVLYRRGDPKPTGLRADGFFETPLRRVITFSTTYIPEIVALGEADSIVGVDNAAFVSAPELRARIESGATVETTRNWNPDIELMISLSPDAVFTYGTGEKWDEHPKMAEAGLPIVVSGDWNESSPLARAEWIKFIAAFYDKEAAASTYFDSIAGEYERVASLAASAKERPSVLVNGPFQGSWTVSGGRSFMARLIADAGGSYLWADDTSTGGLTLSAEAVYERALGADVWLNPSIAAHARADLAALDPRFASLPLMAKGGVWNDTRRMSPGGGNDYFESAVLRPDLVLTDLVKIFHPTLLRDRPFTYYLKVDG